MKNAYLDCVNKRLKVTIADETFTLELQGNEVEVGTVRTKRGDYLTRFDFSNQVPKFSVVRDTVAKEFLQKGNMSALLSKHEHYTVNVDKGSRADYVGIKFPQGINSYLFAFGIMVREADSGSIETYEKLQKIAFEWEEKTIGWDWEEVIYEEALVDFLHTHNFIN